MNIHTRLLLGVLVAATAIGAGTLAAPLAVAALNEDRRGEGSGGAHAMLRARLRAKLIPFLATLGPYALIELILPGGTLIALLLWLHQHRHDPVPLVGTSSLALSPGLHVPSVRPEYLEAKQVRIGLLLLPPQLQDARLIDEQSRQATW
jgi:hypothetical protein